MEFQHQGFTTRRDYEPFTVIPQTVSWNNRDESCYEPRVILPYEPSVECQSPVVRRIVHRRPELTIINHHTPIVMKPEMKSTIETLPNYWNVIDDEPQQMKLWQMKLKVLDFTPKDIQVKVDPTYRVLKVIAKRCPINDFIKTLPNSVNQHIIERVLPLPENIDFTKLMSVFIPTEGILHFKAPLLQKKCNKMENDELFPYFNLPLNQQPTVAVVGDADDQVFTELDKLPVNEYLRLLKKLFTTSWTGCQSNDESNVHIECVNEGGMEGGKWKIQIQFFNTLLDKATSDNMKVLFHQKERRLQLIAQHQINQFGKNVFHREFSLPKYLDVEQLKWRVMDNGLVHIEIPCKTTPLEGKFLHKIPLTY